MKAWRIITGHNGLVCPNPFFPLLNDKRGTLMDLPRLKVHSLTSVREFRHNKNVQSPPETYFIVGRQISFSSIKV